MTLKKKIALFLVCFLLVHVILVALFNQVNRSRNELVLRFESIFLDTVHYKTILAGDSHIERSIDYLDDTATYSIAYFGENNVFTYYKLKYLFENNEFKDPQYIVFPCDIVTFAKGFNRFRSQKGFYFQFLPLDEFHLFEENLLSSYYDYIKVSLFPYVEWQYALNTANKNRNKKSNDKFSDNTKRKKMKMAENFIQNELMCAENGANLFDPIALLYLEKTIQLCFDFKVKPIFVKFPHTQEVFDEISKNVPKELIQNRPSEAIVNSFNIPILNYELLFIDHPELFFDLHHLNNNGKEIFSPLFYNDLDSLYRVY